MPKKGVFPWIPIWGSFWLACFYSTEWGGGGWYMDYFVKHLFLLETALRAKVLAKMNEYWDFQPFIAVKDNQRTSCFIIRRKNPPFLFIHFLFSSYISCWLCWQKGQSVIEPFPPRSCMTVVLAYWGNKDSCFSLGNRKPFSCQHDFFHDPYLTKIFKLIKQRLKFTVKFFPSNHSRFYGYEIFTWHPLKFLNA